MKYTIKLTVILYKWIKYISTTIFNERINMNLSVVNLLFLPRLKVNNFILTKKIILGLKCTVYTTERLAM